MIQILLAESSDTAGNIGRLMGSLLFPALGLLLVVQGLRKRRKGLAAAGAVLMVLSLAGIAATSLRSGGSGSSSASLSVGDCISGDAYAARQGDADAVDCSRDDAVYELAFSGDGSAKCPDGERENSGYSILTTSSRTYCFAPNLQEGNCYSVDTGEDKIAPISCTDSAANLKIDRRIDGSTDLFECGADTNARALPQPPRLFCMTSPE